MRTVRCESTVILYPHDVYFEDCDQPCRKIKDLDRISLTFEQECKNLQNKFKIEGLDGDHLKFGNLPRKPKKQLYKDC